MKRNHRDSFRPVRFSVNVLVVALAISLVMSFGRIQLSLRGVKLNTSGACGTVGDVPSAGTVTFVPVSVPFGAMKTRW